MIIAGRRAQLQNSITSALEHMARNIARAIGDTTHFPINNTSIGSNTAIEITIDSNKNGMLDAGDTQVAYSYNATSDQLVYYANYNASTSTPANFNDTLAYNITTDLGTGNVTYNNTTNYVKVKISGRWDPGNSTSPTNPQVNMTTIMQMPSVSVN